MKPTTKLIMLRVILGFLLMVVGLVFLIWICFGGKQNRFVECRISKKFLVRLHSETNDHAEWIRKPEDIAKELVKTDVFPPDKPPEETPSTFIKDTSGECVVTVLDGFPESHDVIAVWDQTYFQREGDFWIPYCRQVSWQTLKRVGWGVDAVYESVSHR